MSYRGKASVSHQCLGPFRVWYVSSFINVPRWVSAEFKTLVFKFSWSGKRDLVARRVVVQPYCLGGFLLLIFSVRCAFIVCNGFVVLSCLVLGFLSWFFGFLRCSTLLCMLFFFK